MKTLIRRLFSKIIGVLALIVLIIPSAMAEQKVMTVASWLPAGHVQNAIVFKNLKTDIERVTDGHVSLKVEYGMGHPKSLFDLVEDGIVDASWSFHGYMPGRFTLTGMAELPLYNEVDGGKASATYWDVYNKYFVQDGEHDGVYLGALWLHPQGQIHLREPIKSLAELKGKKIRIGGGVQKDIADSFSVAGVSAPGSKVYEILQQGVADGVFIPYGERKSLRLKEVAPYLVELNMYLGSFAFVINEDFLGALSDKNRKAIKDIMGRDFSKKIGDIWQKASTVEKSKISNEYLIKSSDLEKQFKAQTGHIEKAWLQKAMAINDNAEKALREFQSRLK